MTARVHFGDIGSLPDAAGGISRIKFYANGYPTIESGSPLSVSIYNGSAFLASVSAPVGFGGDDYLDCDAEGNVAVSWMRGNVQMQMLEADDFISKMAEADSVNIYDFHAEYPYADVTYTATVSAKLDSEIERAKSAESEVLENAKSYADSKDSENLTAAKNYADTKDSETLASAKSYADTKDSENLEASKAYTDNSMEEIYKYRTMNLFNGNVTEKKVISPKDGSLIDSQNYRTSDFIKVEPSTVYTYYKWANVGYYKADKSFIKRAYTTTESGKATPSNCEYIRLATDLTVQTQMVLKGNYDTVYYEKYKKTLGKDLIEQERWKEKTYFNFVPMGYYQANEQIAWNPTERTVDDIYGIYDALVTAYPNNVTKESLGKDQSGTYDIYKYTFKPEYPEAQHNNKHLPKMVLVSGIHGLERWSIYALAQLMKNIYTDTTGNEILEYFKYNVEFVIIHLANHWGYIQSTRWNSRGVNINRNFDYNWVSSGTAAFTKDYEGTAAFSEVETQYIKKVLYENLDAIGVIDCHTHDTTTWKGCYWHNLTRFSSSYEDMISVSKNNISAITRKMKSEYNLDFD